MISALSAYQDLVLAAGSGRSDAVPEVARNGGSIAGSVASGSDTVDLSVSHGVFAAVDSYFNLGATERFAPFHKLSADEKEQFVKIVAALAQAGYVGYEELVVNRKIEKHDVLNQIGDDRIRDAKLYHPPRQPRH